MLHSSPLRKETPWPEVRSPWPAQGPAPNSPYRNLQPASRSQSASLLKFHCPKHDQILKVIGPNRHDKRCVRPSRHDGNCIQCKMYFMYYLVILKYPKKNTFATGDFWFLIFAPCIWHFGLWYFQEVKMIPWMVKKTTFLHK